MQSCLKCNNTSLKMLSHLALQGSGSYMSKILFIRYSKVAVAAGENCCRKPVLGDVQKSIKNHLYHFEVQMLPQ